MNMRGILLRIEHIATWIDFYPISFGGRKNHGQFCRRLILLQVNASTVKGNQRMFHMRLTVKVSLRSEVLLALFHCDLRLIALLTAASSYFQRNSHADESRTCRNAARTHAGRAIEAAAHVDGCVSGAVAAQALRASLAAVDPAGSFARGCGGTVVGAGDGGGG